MDAPEGAYALTGLRSLSFRDNRLSCCPQLVEICKDLRELDLSKNILKGFPKQILGLRSLESLSLSYNDIRQLPRDMFTLPLQRLDLRGVGLPGFPNDIRKLNLTLTHLALADNHISAVPAWLGALQKLEFFDISRNTAVCTLPAEMDCLGRLHTLELEGCSITEVPLTFCFLSALTRLHGVDESWCMPPKEVLTTAYDVHHDKTEDRRIQEAAAAALRYLFCFYDAREERRREVRIEKQGLLMFPRHCGTTMKYVKKLSLKHNRLCEIPDAITVLKRLMILDLEENLLEAVSVGGVCSLPLLEMLLLRSNRLEYLPYDIRNLRGLKYLDVRENLVRYFPVSFGDLPKLAVLHYDREPMLGLPQTIHDAGLPTTMEFYRDLYDVHTGASILDLTARYLTAVPIEVGLMVLLALNVSSNDLRELTMRGPIEGARHHERSSGRRGSILNNNLKIDVKAPQQKRLPQLEALAYVRQVPCINFTECTNLGSLGLLTASSCNLHTVSPDIAVLRQLRSLILHHNQLNSLPDSLKTLTQLKRLQIAHNQFKTIPDVLQYIPWLEDLTISDNEIREIPLWVSEIRALSILIIENNQLATFPPELRALENLSMLQAKGEPCIHDEAKRP